MLFDINFFKNKFYSSISLVLVIVIIPNYFLKTSRDKKNKKIFPLLGLTSACCIKGSLLKEKKNTCKKCTYDLNAKMLLLNSV